MTTTLTLAPSHGTAGRGQVAGGRGTPKSTAGDRLPAAGSMAWIRAWYGVPAKRGASVRVGGRKARLLSASGGLLHALVWSTGERVSIRPTEVRFA